MRLNIVGGGPSGLYFALLMKRQDPSHEVVIFERDGPDDTFGWGIVFSDQTFTYLEDADGPSFRRILGSCETWDNVDVVHRGEKISIHGNKFSGIARIEFLHILHERCRELGIDVRFHDNVTDLDSLAPADLLVGADGANSIVRRTYASEFQPAVDIRKNKYIWLGTPRLFHGLTLTFHDTEAGVFGAHSYKFNERLSTFIVECSEKTWTRAGFGDMSEEATCAYLQQVFADDLQGQPLLTNNFVKWINFPLVTNRRWWCAQGPAKAGPHDYHAGGPAKAGPHDCHADCPAEGGHHTRHAAGPAKAGHYTSHADGAADETDASSATGVGSGFSRTCVVLLGDALHTAHFSIGSGTKLALEDAIALASALRSQSSVEQALRAFEAARRPRVEAYQAAAFESLLWFENMHDYMYLDPLTFAYRLMTRSKKIDYDKLKQRDPEFIARYEATLARQA